MNDQQKDRKVALIVSKGGLDEVYPALILANGARQSGIDAMIFFTFFGLDAVTKSKVDHLHVNMAGNASSPLPTMVAGLPGMESLAGKMMKHMMDELDVPSTHDMLKMLVDSGCDLYGCELAAKMFKLEKEDFIDEVKDVITVGDFYDLSEGGEIIFT